MQVKLGDFGTVIKFEDSSSTVFLKGASQYFSTPSIWQKLTEGIEVEVKELIENDYYCLWRTFEWAKKELNLPEESHFSFLTNDLKNLKEDLSGVI